jgi:DNA-binding transcriptional LysR family regulator
MRKTAPDVAIRSEIGFEEDLMRRLVEGTLDIALMYTPTYATGLIVEPLFDETLVLVSVRPDDTGPGEDYLYVEWGPGFYAGHSQHYPDLSRPAQVVNIGWLGVQIMLTSGGSCFLPERIVAPMTAQGRLFRVAGSPEFTQPVYMVYARDATGPAHEQSLEGLRLLAAEQVASMA